MEVSHASPVSLKTFHVCLDVRGAIRNGFWKKYSSWSLVGHAKKPDGTSMTEDEILDALLDYVAAGYNVIPLGPPCDGFSYTEGCPGHERGDDDQASLNAE